MIRSAYRGMLKDISSAIQSAQYISYNLLLYLDQVAFGVVDSACVMTTDNRALPLSFRFISFSR